MPKTALQTLPDRLQRTKVGLALNIEGLASIIDEATEGLNGYEARLTALEAENAALKAEVAGLRDLLDGGWTRAETAPTEWENTFLWRWNGSEVDEYFLPRVYSRVHQHCGGWFFKKIVKPTPPGGAIRSLSTSQGERGR